LSPEDEGGDGAPAAGGDGPRRVLLHPEEWEDPPGRRVIGEYHKGDALSMGTPSGTDDRRPSAGRTTDGSSGGTGPGRPFDIGEFVEAMEGLPPIDRVIDINTLEVAAFALLRVLIGEGLRIPIHRKGIIDADVLIRDKEIIFDVNSLQFKEHKLKVWKVVFAYQGKPIVEAGHGVKNGLKIYRFRAFKLMLAMWAQSRKRQKVAVAVKDKDTAPLGK
jgi:hypothetical protein